MIRFGSVLAGGFFLVVSHAAQAVTPEDTAYDNFGGVVVDSQGDCVHTKWQGRQDACGSKTPEPKVEAAPEIKPEPLPVVTLEQRTVFFDFDSAKLSSEGTQKLDQLIALIGDSTRIKGLSVHGFTDQFGSDTYNVALAARRASAVKSYLDSHSNLTANIGEVRGFGKSNPADGCANIPQRAKRIACMASERRVQVELQVEQ